MLPAWCRSRKLIVAGVSILSLLSAFLAIWGCKTPPDHVDLHIHTRPDTVIMPQSPVPPQ